MRAKKTAEVFGIDDSELVGNIHFTRHSFAIDNPQALADFVAEAAPHGPFGLVIIDTGPAHSEADDEDDNPQANLAADMMDLADGHKAVWRDVTYGVTSEKAAEAYTSRPADPVIEAVA